MAKRKAKGLGDTIEQITEVTGIKKLVEFVAGEDCGCEERKKKLNELFPYRNTNCLTEEEYTWLNESGVLTQQTFRPTEQTRLIAIYNRVFNLRQEPTSCASCFREIVLKMQKVFEEYKG
jgi:hypothetical protein